MTVYEKAIRFVMKWEGGLDDDPDDRGGVTKYGVSIRFLEDFARRKPWFLTRLSIKIPVTRETIRHLSRNDAMAIFREEFWPVQFERLADDHPAMAVAAFDTAVNMGMGYAMKLVQRAVSTKDDGVWGPLTWAAIASTPDMIGAAAMIEMRKVRYAEIAERSPSQKKFLRGWMNRANDLAKEVSAYAG